MRTADKFAAGTDANIFLTLFGPKGDSGKQALVGSGKNLFERNQVHIAVLQGSVLGPLYISNISLPGGPGQLKHAACPVF